MKKLLLLTALFFTVIAANAQRVYVHRSGPVARHHHPARRVIHRHPRRVVTVTARPVVIARPHRHRHPVAPVVRRGRPHHYHAYRGGRRTVIYRR